MIVSIINFYYKLNAVHQAEILNLIEMQIAPLQIIFSDILWRWQNFSASSLFFIFNCTNKIYIYIKYYKNNIDVILFYI